HSGRGAGRLPTARPQPPAPASPVLADDAGGLVRTPVCVGRDPGRAPRRQDAAAGVATVTAPDRAVGRFLDVALPLSDLVHRSPGRNCVSLQPTRRSLLCHKFLLLDSENITAPGAPPLRCPIPSWTGDRVMPRLR